MPKDPVNIELKVNQAGDLELSGPEPNEQKGSLPFVWTIQPGSGIKKIVSVQHGNADAGKQMKGSQGGRVWQTEGSPAPKRQAVDVVVEMDNGTQKSKQFVLNET